MFRYRVHLIIDAAELARPMSFRTDVILSRADAGREAAERAWAFALSQPVPLTMMQLLSSSSEVTAL